MALLLATTMAAPAGMARDALSPPPRACRPEDGCGAIPQGALDTRYGSAMAAGGATLAALSFPGSTAVGRVTVDVVRADNTVVRTTLAAPSEVTTRDAGFGTAIAVSSDGMLIAIGAPDQPRGGLMRGKVYVYGRSGDQVGAAPLTVLAGGYASVEHDRFGAALAFDGDVLLVGAPETSGDGFEQGSVVAFVRTGFSFAFTTHVLGAQPQSDFGASVAAGHGYVAVGAPSEGDGALHVLRLLEGKLFRTGTTLAAAAGTGAKGIDGNKFASRVGIGMTVHGRPLFAATRPGPGTGSTYRGGATLFEADSSVSVTRSVELDAPAGFTGNKLGHDLLIGDGELLLSDPTTLVGAQPAGAVLRYPLRSLSLAAPPAAEGAPRMLATAQPIVRPMPAPDDRFGEAIAKSLSDVAVSAPMAANQAGTVEFPTELPAFAADFERSPWMLTTAPSYPRPLLQTIACVHRGGSSCFAAGGIITPPGPYPQIAYARFAIPPGARWFAGHLTEYSGATCNHGSAVSEILIDGMVQEQFLQTGTALFRFAHAIPPGASVLELRTTDNNGTADCDDTLWLKTRFEN